MECPHCWKFIHPSFLVTSLYDSESNDKLVVYYQACPACNQYIVLGKFFPKEKGQITSRPFRYEEDPSELNAFFINPQAKKHKPLSEYIPEDYRREFEEAYNTLNYSAKASAALSRRILQKLLREHANVNPSDLSKEIQEVLDAKTLPSYLVTDIDAIRNIGNFAAHPLKDKSTGQIVDVEAGEADWTLNIIEGLFDFYFVRPTEQRLKRDSLNKKLSSSGKPPMK